MTSGGKRKPAKADCVAGAGRGAAGSHGGSLAAWRRSPPMQQCLRWPDAGRSSVSDAADRGIANGMSRDWISIGTSPCARTVAVSVASWAMAMARTMDSPRPWWLSTRVRSSRWKGSKRRWTTAGVSATAATRATSRTERASARDSSIRLSIEEARDDPAGPGVQAQEKGPVAAQEVE
jgi:hypothetical protein